MHILSIGFLIVSKRCSLVTQEENKDSVEACRTGVRKSRTHPELNLNGNKKGFPWCISTKKETRENMVPLLNEAVDLVTKNIEIFNAFFTLVFTGRF